MIKASQMRLGTPETAPDADEIIFILPVADLKAELRIRHSQEDARFLEAIKNAYYVLDGRGGWLNRAILSQSWIGYVDEFSDGIEIPLPPIASVDLVEYRDEDGDWQTLATSVYGVELKGLFGCVYLKYDQTWPDIYKEQGSIRVTFTAGYGDAAAVLASAYNIRKAMKLLAGHYYHNPTPTFVEPRIVEVPRKIQFGLEHTLGQFKIWNDHS